MAGMGPPPKASAQRRNSSPTFTKLPAAGRQGDVPRWPLPEDVSAVARRDTAQRMLDDQELLLVDPEVTGAKRGAAKRKRDKLLTELNILSARIEAQHRLETELWAELWATPQAVEWERLRWTREVAGYVRWKIEAELGSLDAAKEARQIADRLGLSSLAMQRLRWVVASEEEAEARPRRRPLGTGQRPPDDPRAALHAV